MQIVHDTHDFARIILHARRIDNPAADWILARKEPTRQRLIDNNDARGRFVVAGCEQASLEERNAHGLEIDAVA
jgi:hypothetical protein